MTVDDLYTPDDDASELDAHCLRLAGRLHAAGWAEEAHSIAASLAYLREAMRNPNAQHDGSMTGLIDALTMVRDCSDSIVSVLTETFPDGLTLGKED